MLLGLKLEYTTLNLDSCNLSNVDNPRRACAARVSVVVWCVCVSVFYHSSGDITCFYTKTKVCTALV